MNNNIYFQANRKTTYATYYLIKCRKHVCSFKKSSSLNFFLNYTGFTHTTLHKELTAMFEKNGDEALIYYL